jgi:hypothetical protein
VTNPKEINVTFTYNRDADPGFYVKASTAFIRDGRYSPHAKAVFMLLMTYDAQFEQVYPSQKRLCEEAHMSEKPLRAAIDELKRADLLTVTRRGQGKTNLYKVNLIPLINNFGDNPKIYRKPYQQASRSGTARPGADSGYKTNNHEERASRPFTTAKKGPEVAGAVAYMRRHGVI